MIAPLAVSTMLPVAAVAVILPPSAIAPVLFTLTVVAPVELVMPVIVSVAAVFTSATLPLVPFEPWKEVTVFALLQRGAADGTRGQQRPVDRARGFPQSCHPR